MAQKPDPFEAELRGEKAIPGLEPGNPADLRLLFRTAVEYLDAIEAQESIARVTQRCQVEAVALTTATALGNWLSRTILEPETLKAKGEPN